MANDPDAVVTSPNWTTQSTMENGAMIGAKERAPYSTKLVRSHLASTELTKWRVS